MKKQLLNNFKLRTLLLATIICTVFTGKAWGADETITFEDRYSANTTLDGIAIAGTDFSVTFNKRSGGTSTQYYTNGHAVRWYGGGTLVVSSSTKMIEKIEITYTQTANTVTANVGNYNSGTWEGSSNSVTFSQSGTSGHCRISAIAVTYAVGGGSEKETCDLALTGAPIDLSFDLYNNSTAQVINYTTSSNGAVTVSKSDYVTTVVDETAKTITVTPLEQTPSAQTITVSQAADDTYKAGTVEFTVSIANSAPYVQPTEFDIALNNALFKTNYNGSVSNITDESPIVGSQDNVTVTYAGGGNHYVNDSQIRFYPSNKLTFEAPSGYTIKEIVFSAASWSTDVTISVNKGEYASAEKTWAGDESSVVFTGSGSKGNCQMVSAHIRIAKANESDTRLSTTTTIDGTGITNNNVFSGAAAGKLVATVSAGDDVIAGAAIAWSGDNDEVATIAEDGTVTLVAAGEVTFTATYEGDETNYKGSTATYKMTVINKDLTVPGATAENPYTVAQARAAIDANEGVTVPDVYVKGIISQVDSYNSKYSSITYWISEDGTTANQLQVYSGKGLNNANFSSKEDLQVGDKVVVYGTLKKFNDIYEFDYNNVLVSRKPLVNPTIITAYANATWVAPANVKVSEDVTVYTVEYIADKSKVYKHKVEDNVVPANAAVLLTSNSKGEATTVEVAVEVTDEPATDYEALEAAHKNDLQGSDGTVWGDTNIFCLADGAKGLGFYPVDSSIQVPAGKAYLEINLSDAQDAQAEGAPQYLWFNDDTTAIDSLTPDTAAGNENGEIYSLTGQRVGKNYRGIVIMNGRKVLKK